MGLSSVFLMASCFLLFGLLLVLMGVYQSFLWNGFWFTVGGLRSWVGSFECGFVSQSVVENYFSSTYFVLLVFFVVFDLEVSLLLNLPLQGVLFKNLICYSLFLFFLFFGFGVEVVKGYVSWCN